MEFISLKKKSEFIELKKFGKKINYRFVSITFLENQDDFRLGFQITKKSGNAVFRNKIKRQIKNLINEIFSNQLEIPMNKGFWLLIYVNPKIDKFQYSEYISFFRKKFDL